MEKLTPPDQGAGRWIGAAAGSMMALGEVSIVAVYVYGLRADIFWGGKEDFPLLLLPPAAALIAATGVIGAFGVFRRPVSPWLASAVGFRCLLTTLLPALIGGVARRSIGDGVHFLWAGFALLTILGLPTCVVGAAIAGALRSHLPWHKTTR